MRPKLISLITVSALALVGCSASEAPAPQATASVASTPAVDVAESPSEEEVASAETNEEAFLAQLEVIKEKEDQLEGKLKKKASDEYMLDRGDEYCDLLAEDDQVEPIYSNGKDATDLQIEGMILQSARINLCPAS